MRTLPWTLPMALLTTAFLATAASAHEPEPMPGDPVRLYFNVEDGKLTLSSLAPSARNPTVWETRGSYYLRNGLTLAIPVSAPDPELIINETMGVSGWVAYSYSSTYSGTANLFCCSTGTFSWRLIEGARAAPMVLQCKYNDPYYCDYYKQPKRYAGAFPGHEGAGKPHTHGDGSDPNRPLLSGDIFWVLEYKIPACTSATCMVTSSRVDYSFKVTVDGSTDLMFYSLGSVGKDPEPPEPDPEGGGNQTADPGTGNQTGAGNGTGAGGSGGGGNQTGSGNQTGGSGNTTSNGTKTTSGSGSAAAAFLPAAYDAKEADGAAPGAPVALMAGAWLGLGLWMRRRGRLGAT